MASMVQGEVGLNSNIKTQQAITEQAFNRWTYRGQEAGHDLYHGRGGYYAAGTFRSVSPAQVAKFRETVLGPVLAGSNVAKGMSGNASNEPGNMVAMHQFARGTPGFWMNLKTGEPQNLPTSYMGGKAEAMFMEGPFKHKLAMKEAGALHGEALRKHFGHPGKMPNIGAAIGGTAIDDSRSRAVKGSLEAIRAGKADDLRSGLTGGGRFSMPRSGTKDLLGDADKVLKFAPKSGPYDDFSLHPKEQKANYDLLGEGRRGGFIGQPQKHEVSGSANMTIDFKNMPKGVEARTGKMAGMFKELKINRGRAAGTASQEG
jgi:hypothetical protein